ncbi:MAG: nuclear transport factor 2 family protein [Deltaproteobacteria bacterium]|nr:nuclear transport factor 2 family protein [Deltaproteobacteria bacterium]
MSAVETAVATYIRVFSERDPARRAALIEACWAENGRFVMRSREMRGRAWIAEMADRFLADPNVLGVRVTAIDAQGTTFRFRAVTENRDGTTAEVMDAGEIDADGRIALILTFAGPF